MEQDFAISSAAVSDRGLSDKRPQNEDSFLEMPAIGIFAVADGVGGAQAGEVASQMAVEILGEAFSHLPAGADPEGAMLSSMEQANSAIFQMAHELPQLATMATTIVALHLNGNIATIGHVGDSRLYRVDPHRNIFRETDDHSVVAEEVRAGRMTEEQADNHPSKNVISRALGAEGTVQPDLKTIMVDPGTSFLLCSDGITRHVSDDEICNALAQGENVTDICSYLKDLVYERGAEDNLTALVVRVGEYRAPADESATEEMPSLDTLEAEEATIATSRPQALDDDELLELETGELRKPLVANDTIVHRDEDNPDASRPIAAHHIQEQERTPPANLGGIGTFIGGLIIGALIGVGIYYFVLAPKAAEQAVSGPLSEMRAANIPLSAFEENRRDVDKDPAGYITRFASNPQDCEDYYLLGRAYLLSGDPIKARQSFTEARNHLGDADPVNQKTIADDIALAFVVTNDTTAQRLLKDELDQASKSANANANAATNSNTSAPQRTPPPIVN